MVNPCQRSRNVTAGIFHGKMKGRCFYQVLNRSGTGCYKVREIVKKYARKAGINKRIHPHLFRHQILTYLTSKGIVDAKIQLISGHKSRESLSIYQDLSLADVDKEYWEVMEDFPIQ